MRVPPQPSPCFKERKFENCGKIKLSSCVLSLHSRCGKEVEEGEKRRGNWKDGGSSFFFPSLSLGIFTKFLDSCLTSLKKTGSDFLKRAKSKALLRRQIVTLVIVKVG